MHLNSDLSQGLQGVQLGMKNLTDQADTIARHTSQSEGTVSASQALVDSIPAAQQVAASATVVQAQSRVAQTLIDISA